ncbi:hypothetical protein [Capnocytophaga cynodegmi]|uniref:EF-hand domain-containing protein n=1 Tax=Capnocytophaga cynodegmi TaxID=28189 RepID=A0A0B7H845_9FLAO|nr:hypothetical protein [Capnocytophaga cynodegmi]CEN35776.1 hypothetical protein CCYN2B_290012 [Capnocytophaga cynodegmi]
MSPIYHKGTRVKVISKTDKYTRVEPLEKIVIGRANNWTFLGDIDKDGNVITKYPIAKNERKSFWIENLFVGQEEHKGEKGNKNNVLTTSLPHIYLTDPELEAKKRNKSVHYEDKLSQKVVVDIRLCKEKVKYDAAEWIYVKSHYYREGKTIYNQGWVEIPKKEERFSAYHWDKFGFKTYEAGKERFYKVEGILQEEETSPFITEVIKRIDTNGNKKIDHFELRNSYNTSEVSHILSRMVCKHKSEWSYDVDKIKQDTKTYFEKIKNHFKQEYEPQKGKTEAENENLSKHLDNLLDSVLLKAKALYFWDEQFAKKTGLPADGFVWHFEPFAWVEQMKRVFDVLDKNTIYITRKWEKWTGKNESSATFGTFKFGDLERYICEPYGPETTERNKDKRIPLGTYSLM